MTACALLAGGDNKGGLTGQILRDRPCSDDTHNAEHQLTLYFFPADTHFLETCGCDSLPLPLTQQYAVAGRKGPSDLVSRDKMKRYQRKTPK